MKRLFSNKVRVILVAAVVIAVVLAVLSSLVGFDLPGKVVQGVLAPIRTGVSKLSGQAQRLYDYTFRYEELAAENEHLKQQISDLQEEARKADAIARENRRLRKALELTDDGETYKLLDGYIISRSSTEWSNTFTINRGTNAGIQKNMCAVTESGELVGLVSEVGTNYAVIKSAMDSSLEISATIASSGYNGMVKGGYADGDAENLRMNYLPSNAVIRNHDQVVTSGSTMYPRNLILGYVIDAGFDDTGVAKFAVLKPAVDPGSLEQVFIITNYEAG